MSKVRDKKIKRLIKSVAPVWDAKAKDDAMNQYVESLPFFTEPSVVSLVKCAWNAGYTYAAIKETERILNRERADHANT